MNVIPFPGQSPAGPSTILPLQVRELCFQVGGTLLLDHLNLELRHGPRTLLIGPNGSGKSLTLRLLHGLIRPSSGTIRWDGLPPDRHLRTRQAMVFQRPVLLRRTVRANIDYVLRIHGMGRAQRRERIDEVLAQAGLEALGNRSARVLSGGEQQRLAIARAWALRPEVLFLDEPTSNLDPGAALAVEGMIDTIHQRGTKILMTTHDMGQARRLGDEILFLHRGRLLDQADADTFFGAPESQEARAFLQGGLVV
ncbi:ATP-binding cassette domain-containing protein [Thiohalorhabdus sp. Cl-TMA]|uniref:ATP-binding cassette domain-containing protein n=1 Tax=Thiohalorhabdus methylotrophus TaxID=3242694 RepID=A0ABV4TVW2_9GAMM